MNIESVIFLAFIVAVMDFLIIKYGRRFFKKFYWRIFLTFNFIVGIFIGIFIYRAGFLGHMDYIDGKLHRPERVTSIPKPVAPNFDNQQERQIWEDSKKEFRNSVNSFDKP